MAGDAVLVDTRSASTARPAAELGGDHDEAVAALDRLLTDPTHRRAWRPRCCTPARAARSPPRAGSPTPPRATGPPPRCCPPPRAARPSGRRARHPQRRAAARAGVRGRAEGRLQALALARTAGARTVEARILAVLGFSLAYLENTKDGADALDRRSPSPRAPGEPEAIGEAHLRRAELLAGPLNQLDEGIAYARKGVERMGRSGSPARRAWRCSTYAANALFRLGRWEEAQRAVADAWKLRRAARGPRRAPGPLPHRSRARASRRRRRGPGGGRAARPLDHRSTPAHPAARAVLGTRAVAP